MKNGPRKSAELFPDDLHDDITLAGTVEFHCEYRLLVREEEMSALDRNRLA